MSRRRAWIVVSALACGVLVVVGRAVHISFFEHELWARRARQQHQRVLSVPSARGDIRSADGYLVATSVDRIAIQVDTQLLHYPRLFALASAQILGCSPDEVLRRLNCGARAVWLAQRVEKDVAEAVRALAPTAVVLVPDSQRLYPLGSVAAAVVGFTGREELRIVGRAGFEHHFDALLAGEPGQYLAVNDAVQRQLRLERLQAGRAGYDLELTIHARLQAACERELARTVERFAADAASAVVLDAHTGTVLALASLPSFDPAAPGKVSPECWRLRPVQDAFEPGSTAKTFVMAAALASGLLHPHEVIDCRHGGIRVAGRWVRDHAEPGRYSLDQVISRSSNTGIITLAQRLPPKMLWQSFDAFGFGRRAELGFPAEAPGILPPVHTWSSLSAAGLALGQEVTASPLQVALAYAAIANGGWLPRPRLLVSASTERHALAVRPQWRRRVMDEALAGRLRDMLELAVSDGTGALAQVDGYRVAGKTGTAQRSIDGRFDDRHHVAWFAGFLPLPDPSLVIVVAVENPSHDFWASTVAAPAFSRIAGAAVHLLSIAPGPATDAVHPGSPAPGGAA